MTIKQTYFSLREKIGLKTNQLTQKDTRKRSVLLEKKNSVNPLNPIGDQDRVSPYNVNTI